MMWKETVPAMLVILQPVMILLMLITVKALNHTFLGTFSPYPNWDILKQTYTIIQGYYSLNFFFAWLVCSSQ